MLDTLTGAVSLTNCTDDVLFDIFIDEADDGRTCSKTNASRVNLTIVLCVFLTNPLDGLLLLVAVAGRRALLRMDDGGKPLREDGIALAGLEYCLLGPEALETMCVTALAGLLYCLLTLDCGSVSVMLSEVSWFPPDNHKLFHTAACRIVY